MQNLLDSIAQRVPTHAPSLQPLDVDTLDARQRLDKFEVQWATQPCEVREAQRLRHRVFVDEMGARLVTPPGSPSGYDIDRFDDFCEHLLVRPVLAGGEPGEVVGTYRVLTPDAARRAGGLYSETEFDLHRVRPLLGTAVELGRSCVHPDWRSGSVVMTLWAALGEFMLSNDLDTMVGCASISVRDGGHAAASLWARLSRTHLAAPEWRATPHLPLPLARLRQDLEPEVPALIKGYLRCGARLLGEPAWDPDFQTADLPLMMRFADLPARYRKHFLGG
ncbi:MAG: GNAT family N-acyltransferase [Caldimonas sp.]